LVAAVNGGIASGKDTVTSMLSKYADLIIDADNISRWLFKQKEQYIYTIFNVVSKKELSKLVFSDKSKMLQLESIVEKDIKNHILRVVENYAGKKNCLVLLNHPTLFHYKLELFCDIIIGVKASHDVVIERLINNRKISPEQAEKMYRHQIERNQTVDLHYSRYDTIIDNNGSVENLEKQVLSVWNNIIREKL